MKKIFASIFMVVFCGLGALTVVAQEPNRIEPVEDVPFRQPTSLKFKLNDRIQGAKLHKVVVDYRDNVFVLTNQGLCRDFPEGILAKDYTYASLVDLQPVDITIQEGTGYLYYLYPNQYLTNAHAGTIYGKFDEGKYQQILVNSDDEILLLGKSGGALYQGKEKLADVPNPAEPLVQAGCSGKDFYYLTENCLYKLENKVWKPLHKGQHLTCLAVSKGKIYLGTIRGYYAVSLKGEIVDPLTDRVPVSEIRDIVDVQGTLWFITRNGAYCREPDRYRYFAWKRWLDQNDIKDMAFDSEGNVYLLTETGLNEIKYLTQTLAEKAATVQKDIEKNHIRFGWSVAGRLAVPDDPTSLSLRDNDNDGLWTSIYLGSQVFRYATTGEELARRNVWESFEAFERNLTVHPLKGFSSRTFERKGFAGGPEWRDAPEEDWVWKGTTSTDEVVGYIFVADLIDRFVAKTPEEKKRVADYLDAMLMHVIENNYYMIDHDGQPTLWARWNQEYVNGFAETQFDRRLNSALITAMLQLGYRLTGKELYKDEMFRLWKEWGYWDNMLIPMKNVRFTSGFQHQGIVMGQDWNHSDDEMAFLTYWVLHKNRLDDSYKKDYDWMVNDHWEIERPERNALWNIIPYALTGHIDRDSTVWWLREFNMDRWNYRMKNSHRKDVEQLSLDLNENFRAQESKELLTQGEQRMMRHNANGFHLNGGQDYSEKLTGEEFLLPYWMCRYYGVIK